MEDQSRRVVRTAALAIGMNTLLVVGKLIVGLSAGSVSILSEAAHSGVDLLAAVLAWAAIRYAQRPPARTHPYGHGKVEALTGLGEGILTYAYDTQFLALAERLGCDLWTADERFRRAMQRNGFSQVQAIAMYPLPVT